MHKLSSIVPKWLSYQIGFGCEYGHYSIFRLAYFFFLLLHWSSIPNRIRNASLCGHLQWYDAIFLLCLQFTHNWHVQYGFYRRSIQFPKHQVVLTSTASRLYLISLIKQFTRMTLRNIHATKCNAMQFTNKMTKYGTNS